jgi:DNA mismatch repair protein MutL
MAPRIHVLDDGLASQIAAGEVVERPASVVKELVENALDAGATQIRIEIDGGGRTRIRVTDDGSGMSREEAALAVERHATSKISVVEDLGRIATFGFRGEALPSIASVSRFTLTTRRAEDAEGTSVRIQGGDAAEVAPAGCAPGTQVDVQDLFFATPARLKFLKTERTEAGHAVDAAVRIALGAPGAAFKVTRDGKVAVDLLQRRSLSERVREVFTDVSLWGAQGEAGDIRVVAWLSAPQDARAGASALHVLVNGRFVRDRGLLRAVSQSYGGMLEPGRYPAGALFVTLPPEDVDVNVHPQKVEVRFARGDRVIGAVTSILSDVYRSSPWARPGSGDPAEEARAHLRETVAAYAQPDLFAPARPGSSAEGMPAAPAPGSSPEGKTSAEPAYATLVPLAQVRFTYLVCEGPDGLYLLDQHAAHERVTFDRLRRAYRASDVEMQALLFPERVEVGSASAAVATESREALVRLGLEVEPLGEGSLAIRAVPALVARADPGRLLRDVLAEVGGAGPAAFQAAVDHVLATMACHGSIRAGDRVSMPEARALLASLDGVDFSGNCPHGRPILHALRWSELERRVGRR